MLELISSCDNTVISYFFEKFKIKNKYGFCKDCIFPYAGQLLDIMITNNNTNINHFVKKAINYNKEVQKQLTLLKEQAESTVIKYYKEFILSFPVFYRLMTVH